MFAENASAWDVIPFTFDALWQPFFASNDRIEPQELDVAVDRATAEPR